jgi:hypothetical protein
MEVGMKTWTRLSAGFAASIILLSGIALAQDKPAGQDKSTGCEKAGVREKVEGQVTKVDPDQGKLTVQGPNGETYEFLASKETLQGYKVGDRIEARLRVNPACKPSGSG